jgi:hypothetical protein
MNASAFSYAAPTPIPRLLQERGLADPLRNPLRQIAPRAIAMSEGPNYCPAAFRRA